MSKITEQNWYKKYYKKYLLSEKYQSDKKKIGERLKEQRQDKCHEDIDWILDSVDVDITTGKLLSHLAWFNDKTGYYQFVVYGKTYLVHRIVWMTANRQFIPADKEINHINQIKTDNRIENLELISHIENIQKYWRHPVGLQKRREKLEKIWEILEFHYIQPINSMYKNTMNKFGISKACLNRYTYVFRKDVVLDKNPKTKELWINRILSQNNFT